MEAVFLKLLNMSLTACWLVFAVVILRLLLKKAPKAIICGLWALVALRLLIPVSIESMFSLIPDPEPVTSQIVYDTHVYHSPEVILESALEETAASLGSAPKEESVSVLSVVSVGWIVGVVLMLLYTAVSYVLLLRRTREGVEREKGIWLCDRIASPFILGVINPRIFLPSDLEPEDEAFVVAHERAHLKRLDHLWKPLGFLLLSVYWFNPVMWLAYILLCRDIELACDEKVLQQLGTEVKQDYSTALINCSVPRRMISACPLAFGESGVKGRIKAILNYKKPAFWIILIALVAAVVVAVCFLTNPPKEQEPAKETVTLELVGRQKDSLTVEWANNTDEHIVIGYEMLYVKEDGEWVVAVSDFPGRMNLLGWTRSLAPGQTYQQIVYYYYIGITEPGEYRLDMKYVNPAGEEALIPLEFEVTQVEEYELNYAGPVWDTKLICEESPDPLKPKIMLSNDGQFLFQYSGYSSYVAVGTYEESSEELVLTTNDGSDLVYRFKKDGGKAYRFDAANSSQLPQYKYDGELQSPVPDGGLFLPSATTGRVITAASLPAYVDSDDIPEYWTVTQQPSYGLYVFEITAVTPEGFFMYRDIFQYEFEALALYKDPDGKLQLLVTKADGPDGSGEIVTFDISVENGHIALTSEQEILPHLDYSVIQ